MTQLLTLCPSQEGEKDESWRSVCPLLLHPGSQSMALPTVRADLLSAANQMTPPRHGQKLT